MIWSPTRQRAGRFATMLLWLAVAGPAASQETHRVANDRGMPGASLVPFEASPFPYDGDVPEQNRPFLQKDDGDARFYHLAPRAGKLYGDTYDDRRSLLYAPRRFDPRKPGAAILLFFHGNKALLARDVEHRQRVPAQVEASGRNVVLVAPQLAKDALDSSPGRFYQPGFLDLYLDEAARQLAEHSHGRFTAADVARLPVVVVAYSGGYLATAFSLKYRARTHARIAAVVLLDALFGEEAKFADWIADTHEGTIFVSAYSDASAALNAQLTWTLESPTDRRATQPAGADRRGRRRHRRRARCGPQRFRDARRVAARYPRGHPEAARPRWSRGRHPEPNMSLLSGRAIPKAPLALGLAGLLPFWGLSLALLVGEPTDVDPRQVDLALATYAAIIVSFLGGIRWGFAVAGNVAKPVPYAISVVPSLLGWGLLAAPEPWRLVGLGIVALALGAIDTELVREGRRSGLVRRAAADPFDGRRHRPAARRLRDAVAPGLRSPARQPGTATGTATKP